ncbi:hypothetical protein NFX46_40045 (plasmid) [Streptomyces phaeoluteigriseus]|uniref:GNAT family N-acetyltransferase n=1 Tax=Streptomyces phaeoluteigriseus TaxID=114686 RepID=A0ABY4ZLZ8_9ACTN|nr:hypothetical protein [Streptomyces phaeoluteigriseus]USQ89881.1 hypothetical protein NFX46_40045 [Streptomyces phaeoluteigriseus]
MRASTDSWLITTEVPLEPEYLDDDWVPSSCARFVTIPTAEALGRRVHRRSNDDDSELWELQWDRRTLPLRDYRREAAPDDIEKVLHHFLEEAFRRAGHKQVWLLSDAALAAIMRLPVPVPGSFPKNFQPLTYLVAGGPGTSVAIVDGLGPDPSLMLIFGGSALSMIMTLLIVPAMRGVGRGLELSLEHQVKRVLGAPSAVDSEEGPQDAD